MVNNESNAYAGQAIYSDLVLKVYNFWVLGITNSFIWQCPTSLLLEHFNKHVSTNHLDIGVGTGYFIEHCKFSSPPRIALMDLNPNSINAAANVIKRYNPECYHQNILEPITQKIEPFDSISMNYLLHCLPGNMHQKTVAFDTIQPLLKKGGIFFGSTVLHEGVDKNFAAKKLMSIYNSKGIFSNQNDSAKSLEECLKKRFDNYEIKFKGCVALFWAKAK